MSSQSTLGILKAELKSLFRQALAAREMSYMWTHFLPARRGFYDRWIAVQNKDAPKSGSWDVFYQEYKVLPRTLDAHGDKRMVAEGVSTVEAIRILRHAETSHPQSKKVSRFDRWCPTSHHYSRAEVVVEDMAKRVSAASMTKMRRRRGGPHA